MNSLYYHFFSSKGLNLSLESLDWFKSAYSEEKRYSPGTNHSSGHGKLRVEVLFVLKILHAHLVPEKRELFVTIEDSVISDANTLSFAQSINRCEQRGNNANSQEFQIVALLTQYGHHHDT